MLPQNPERIVLFTDSSSIDTSLRALLQEQVPGLEILHAGSTQGYLSLVRERPCAVAILDYDIPGIREAELLARLRLLDDEPEVLLLSRCESSSVIKRIAESNRRYVVRDSQVVSSLSLAIRDLMRIRRLEREMATLRANLVRANARLQEQNDRLDDFCVTLAHDIRVPLSALSLKMEYLLDGPARSLDERGRGTLARSVDAVHHLLRVVEATYDLSRLGRDEISMSRVDIKKLVLRVSGEIRATTTGVLEVECGDIPPVQGNEALLERVFLNLMSNSIKYSNQQTTRVTFQSGAEGHTDDPKFVWLVCGDNGPGIPKVDQGQVFGMFKRGGNKDAKEGLGVGLAVVQRIVELHGGSVHCEDNSVEGKCQIVLRLPRVG